MSMSPHPPRPVHVLAVLAGGALIIGSLDAAFATLFWIGAGPIRIFQSIAAGLFGHAAFNGGLPMAFLGMTLHYAISFAIVLVYWTVSRWLQVLTRRPVICGAIYGVLVYIVMNYVVIPLSATSRPRFLLSWVGCSIVVHAFLIGVPAALFSRAALNDSKTAM